MIFRMDGARSRLARYRPAYSLIEMLVVISITVVLLSLMYRAIVGVLKRASEPDTAIARFEAVSIGSQRLREDLRRTDSFRIDDDGQSIEATASADRVIRWRIADRPLRLERREPGSETASNFGLTGFRSGRFERFEISSGNGPLVRLTLVPERSRRGTAGVAGDDRPLTVEFAVGTAIAPGKATGNDEKGAKP